MKREDKYKKFIKYIRFLILHDEVWTCEIFTKAITSHYFSASRKILPIMKLRILGDYATTWKAARSSSYIQIQEFSKDFITCFQKLTNEQLEKIFKEEFKNRRAWAGGFNMSIRIFKFLKEEYLKHLGYKPETEAFKAMMKTDLK